MRKFLPSTLSIVFVLAAATACSSDDQAFCQTFKDQGGTAPDLNLYLAGSVEEAKDGLDQRLAAMDLTPPEEIATDWETVRSFFAEQRENLDLPDASTLDVFMAPDDVKDAMDVIQNYHMDACL